MIKEKIERVLGSPAEQNRLFGFKIKWEGGGEKEVELTTTGLQGLIDEHGSPSPHAGLAKLASVKLNGQQIWP